jgi:hypothetical protein
MENTIVPFVTDPSIPLPRFEDVAETLHTSTIRGLTGGDRFYTFEEIPPEPWSPENIKKYTGGDTRYISLSDSTPIMEVKEESTPANNELPHEPTIKSVVSEGVIITLNYSKASHLLHGLTIRDTYIDFRIKVLREVGWATWHGRLTRYQCLSKGWCIKKANYADLITALGEYGVPYVVKDASEYATIPKKPTHKDKPKGRKPKVTPTPTPVDAMEGVTLI